VKRVGVIGREEITVEGRRAVTVFEGAHTSLITKVTVEGTGATVCGVLHFIFAVRERVRRILFRRPKQPECASRVNPWVLTIEA